MDMQELGAEFHARRKELGLSQNDIASKNKMSRATISQLENGKLPELGLRKFLALCASVGLSVEVKEANARPTLRDWVKENNHA